MKKQKLTKNQFRKMIQEEISKLTLEAEAMSQISEDGNYHEIGSQIGDQPDYHNNLGMGTISEDESEGENTYWVQKYDEAAWEKLMDEMVEDERLTINTANLLTMARHKLMPLTPEDIDVIELSHPTAGRSDKFSESKKITKGMILQMLQEEFQNIMSEGEYEDAINALAGDAEEAEEEIESTEFAESIAALETMHQNLEGIIDRLKEVPGAPLGTDIAMALSGLDEQEEREEQ